MTAMAERIPSRIRRWVRSDTRDLRTGEKPYWTQLRALLLERGIDPQRAIVATSMYDQNEEHVVGVTGDGGVFHFMYVLGETDEESELVRTDYEVGSREDNSLIAAARDLLREERGEERDPVWLDLLEAVRRRFGSKGRARPAQQRRRK